MNIEKRLHALRFKPDSTPGFGFYLCLLAVLFIASSASPAQDKNLKSIISDSLNREEALDHYLNGTVAEEADEMLQAAVEYQLALLLDEKSAAIRIALAEVYKKLGHQKAALLVLERGREVNPKDEELLKLLAELYLRFDRHSEAADCYKDISELRPLDRMELLRLAAILAAASREDEALQFYAECIGRFGAEVDIYYKIGLIHLGSRNIAAAETTYKQLVKLDPTQHRVLFVLGGFAVAREDWSEAEAYFRQALEADSMDIRYWTNLAMALDAQEKYEPTLETVDAALKRFPETSLLYDMRARALEQLKRFEEALVAADSSIGLDDSRLQPYLTKGYVLHSLSRWDEAAEAYERALEISPDNPTVLNNYAYLLAQQNYRIEDALKMIDRALELRPKTGSFIDTRAWLFYRLGRYDVALKELKKALKNSEGSAELYEHLGFIYQALGKTSKSLKAWRKALELDPDNETYQRLLD